MSDLRYPVGKNEPRNELTAAQRRECIDTIAAGPAKLRAAVRGLTDAQLDTPYRDGGWTVRQVVHHLPDSHMNAFIRLKLALTENNPTIRPYDESQWANLADARITPTEVSLVLLESLHERWVGLLRALGDDDFRRTFKHPDHAGTQTVDWLVSTYAWHSRHHVGHITALRERLGW
jgi:hypothetical protein